MNKLLTGRYERYIIKSIDSEVYDIKTTGRKQKLQFLMDTFKKEAGWNIERVGEQNAFRDWTQGLPSVFGIEFENYQILNLAQKMGSLPKKATEKQEDRILENYWNFIANITFKMFKKYKIN